MMFLLPAALGVVIIAAIGYGALIIERRNKANDHTDDHTDAQGVRQRIHIAR